MNERNSRTSGVAHTHGPVKAPSAIDEEAFERAASLFRAAGDIHRLRLMEHLGHGELCVTELAEAFGAKMSTLSQQLRVLRTERIVKQRRDGKHIYYSLVDEHVRDMIRTALDHASEPGRGGGIVRGR